MALLISTFLVVAVSMLLPFTPLSGWFEFVEPPVTFYLFLALFVGAYLVLVEVLKRLFFKRYAHRLEQALPQDS
jgi:Mg2+-importing ATPase